MTADDDAKRLTQEEADTVRKAIEEVEREEAAALAAVEEDTVRQVEEGPEAERRIWLVI